jgi:hypothetical protein
VHTVEKIANNVIWAAMLVFSIFGVGVEITNSQPDFLVRNNFLTILFLLLSVLLHSQPPKTSTVNRRLKQIVPQLRRTHIESFQLFSRFGLSVLHRFI